MPEEVQVIREKFSSGREVLHWNRLLREVVESPPLNSARNVDVALHRMPKAGLDDLPTLKISSLHKEVLKGNSSKVALMKIIAAFWALNAGRAPALSQGVIVAEPGQQVPRSSL